MFGTHYTLKQLSRGIAVAASLAVVAAPSAFGAPFITDTLGGNGHVAKATPDVLARYVANHAGPATQVQGYRFITDTLGGNGNSTRVSSYNPQAYVYGGASPGVSSAIQALGHGRTASPPVSASPTGSTFNWGDAAIGGGMVAAGLLLLLLGVTRLRMNKRPAITA